MYKVMILIQSFFTYVFFASVITGLIYTLALSLTGEVSFLLFLIGSASAVISMMIEEVKLQLDNKRLWDSFKPSVE